jgi:hypothetical protein
MINLKTIRIFLRDWCLIFVHAINDTIKSRITLEIEIMALRSQLALFQQQVLESKIPKPRPIPAFRQLWVVISKLCSNWKSFLLVVKPETVIGWHRTAFRFYWARKSKPRGRPKSLKQQLI